MIIILHESATDEQVDHVVQRVEGYGLKPHLSRGTYPHGDRRHRRRGEGPDGAVGRDPGRGGGGARCSRRSSSPAETAHPEPSIVEVGSGASVAKFGGGHVGMIAGPCAIESPERLDEIAGAIKAAGATVLRGGAYKPRTSPYSFQGLGEEGLKILREVGDQATACRS